MSDPSNYVPPWIRYMQRDTGNWGLLIYRCASYKNPERWARYRAALDKVWEASWEYWWRSFQHIGVTEEMYEMLKTRMELVWVEGEEKQGWGVDEVRGAFKRLQNAMPSSEEPRLTQDPWNLDLPIPYHMDRYVALYVDEECVSSLLGPEDKEVALPDTNTALRKHTRHSYVVAVDAEYSPGLGYASGKAPEPYTGWAKISVGVIFTEFVHRRIYVNSLLSLDTIYSQAFERESSGGVWRG
ncbi:hypothetical protein N7535_000526 [Penicillium sp. DV-2018c]|nr:hypothetical protein N7461_006226 [Penicillium sp. DV-2018c]KAJ5581906.1 hypothetical protein N7535_000526 [Penicillium sp. DV-2018c]